MSDMKRKGGLAFQAVFAILLGLYAVVLISLFFYAFYTSCKSLDEFVYNTWAFPKEWHFENYATILSKFYTRENATAPVYYIEAMFGMSVLYSLLAAAATTIATTLMAYACYRFPCRLSRVIQFIVMFMIVVPIIGAYPSEYKMIHSLGIYNRMFGVFFLKFSFGSIYFLLIYEALRQISKDFVESAEVDGASMLRVMAQIVLPMCGNIIGSVFLVQFVFHWNDYNTPLLYFPKYPNISLGLLRFSFNTTGPVAGEPFKLGACFLVLLPILVIFAVFQKALMNNISAGGLKG